MELWTQNKRLGVSCKFIVESPHQLHKNFRRLPFGMNSDICYDGAHGGTSGTADLRCPCALEDGAHKMSWFNGNNPNFANIFFLCLQEKQLSCWYSPKRKQTISKYRFPFSEERLPWPLIVLDVSFQTFVQILQDLCKSLALQQLHRLSDFTTASNDIERHNLHQCYSWSWKTRHVYW